MRSGVVRRETWWSKSRLRRLLSRRELDLLGNDTVHLLLHIASELSWWYQCIEAQQIYPEIYLPEYIYPDNPFIITVPDYEKSIGNRRPESYTRYHSFPCKKHKGPLNNDLYNLASPYPSPPYTLVPPHTYSNPIQVAFAFLITLTPGTSLKLNSLCKLELTSHTLSPQTHWERNIKTPFPCWFPHQNILPGPEVSDGRVWF